MILSFALTDQDISVFIMLRIILYNPIALALKRLTPISSTSVDTLRIGTIRSFDLGVM